MVCGLTSVITVKKDRLPKHYATIFPCLSYPPLKLASQTLKSQILSIEFTAE